MVIGLETTHVGSSSASASIASVGSELLGGGVDANKLRSLEYRLFSALAAE